MTFTLRATTLTGLTALVLAFAPASFAEDAMKAAPMASDAMAADAMAPDAMHADAMAPMSDEELKACLDKAAMVAGAEAMKTAETACHDMHNGMMAPDAMAPADAMAPDAMAPDAMAPAKP